MKRKLLSLTAALLCAVGVSAYTTSDLTSAGWTKETSSLSDINSKVFVFVDAGAKTTAMFRGEEPGFRPRYNTLADPYTNPSEVWVLESNSTNFAIKGLEDGYYFISGTEGWNDYMNESSERGVFTFTLNDTKWDITSTSYSGNNYVGPWNNGGSVSGTPTEDIAVNKSSSQAPGFEIYSMPRSAYLKRYLQSASSSNKINLTALIDHAKITDTGATGWTTSYTDNGQYNVAQYGYNLYECYNKSTISFKQDVNLIQYATFELGVKGFYRPGDGGTTATTENAKLYAGSQTTNIALINSVTSNTEAPNTGSWLQINSSYYVPNNMAAAEYAIYTDGKYSNTLSNISLTSGSSVELGIKKDAGIANDWTIFNSFSLKCTGLQLQAITESLPVGSDMESNTWYYVFIPTAGNYNITSTSAATITYTQDGTKIAGESTTGTAVSFAASDQKSIALTAGKLYIKSSVKQTVSIDMRFYLSTTVGGVTKYLNKDASGITYAYNSGLPFTLERNNDDSFKLKFSEGNYLNDVGSNWQTKAEGSNNNEWEVASVEGGYKLLLGVDNRCQLVVINATTGLVEMTRYTDNGNVWQFIQPETALSYATTDAETHTLGFEDGEYAPYNNVTAIKALATAKAATTNDDRISAYTALTAATWTVNVGEVNAIYWPAYTAESEKDAGSRIYAMGWGKASSSDAYNTRIVVGTAESNPGIYNYLDNHEALMTKYTTTYGEETGYTMPLKASTIYKLSFKYGGMENTPTVTIMFTDPESNTITLAPNFTPVNANAHNSGTVNQFEDYEGFFVTNAAGNYVLNLTKSDLTQQQIAMGNISLVTASELPFSDGSVPTYAPGIYPSVKIIRTLTANRWATAVYPFEVSGVDNIAVLDSYNASTGAIGFTTAEHSTANQPFLMYSIEGVTQISLSNVDVAATVAEPKVTKSEASLKGAYAATDITNAEKNYVLSNNVIYPVGSSGVTINPYRAYIQIDQTSPVKALNFFIDGDEADRIDSLTPALSEGEGAIYNVAGQRLNKVQKGINIVNGKKIMK